MVKNVLVKILENGKCKNSKMRSKIISRFKKIKIEKGKERRKNETNL